MTTENRDWLGDRFEELRPRLRAVAYRILGSVSEAEDAVQEAWLRLSRTDSGAVENPGGWLTTVVSRIALNLLRSRETRREEPIDFHVPDPIVTRAETPDPDQEVLLADSVGLALQVVLETLTPAERLAFVLHDLFALPFEEIAPVIGRTPAAARQLASRARRRVQGKTAPKAEADRRRQREVVDAFLAAARNGEFEGLLAVLDPEVVLRSDAGARGPGLSKLVRGARAVASGAVTFSRLAGSVRPVLVNGAAGLIAFDPEGRPLSVAGFTVADGKIVEINILTDPERLGRLDLES